MMFAEAPVKSRKITHVRQTAQQGLRVSAVIITYNEERIIQKTLDKLHWCDEIVIVDSHSTDNTVSICRQYGCQVYFRHFDGYGSQKQFAVSKASNDWVLCIDADEVLSDKLVQEITSLSEKDLENAAFSFPMNLVFLNKEFTYGKESGRYFLRMFNKKKGGFTAEKVHEGIQVNGTVKKMQHIIKHYSYCSIYQYLDKLNRYTSYSAEMAFKKGKNRSVAAVVLSIPLNFLKYYLLERNFMNGAKGFYWSAFSAYSHYVKYIKIKELHEAAKHKPFSDKFLCK